MLLIVADTIYKGYRYMNKECSGFPRDSYLKKFNLEVESKDAALKVKSEKVA